MNWKIMGIGMVCTVPLLYFLARGFEFNPRDLPDEMVGATAPDFKRTSLDGYEVSFKDLKGGPIVLNFWSSWCKPCLVEHADLLSTASAYKPKGVVFLGVLYADDVSKGKNFIKKHKSAYPTLIDETQRMAIDFGVSGVPETFVIDKSGTIVKKFKGPITKQELSSVLDGLL